MKRSSICGRAHEMIDVSEKKRATRSVQMVDPTVTRGHVGVREEIEGSLPPTMDGPDLISFSSNDYHLTTWGQPHVLSHPLFFQLYFNNDD